MTERPPLGWIEPCEGGFRAVVQRSGERHCTEVATSRAGAQTLLRELLRELITDPRVGTTRFADWVEEWKAWRAVSAAPATIETERSRLKHLVAAFGPLMLCEIDAPRVQRWIRDSSGTRSPATVRHRHGLLQSVLQHAVDSDRLRVNPCVLSQLPPAAPRKPHVLLSAEDLAAFVDSFTDATARALVITAAGTGMTWGEVAGLRVGHVDLAARRAAVRGVLADGVELRLEQLHDADAARRSLEIGDVVATALRPLVDGKDPDGLVFVSSACDGSCPDCAAVRQELDDVTAGHQLRLVHAWRNARFRREHWDPAVDAAAGRGMQVRPTPQDLRHTHAALLFAAGVPVTVIQRRLGHRSLRATTLAYGYLMRRRGRGSERVLEALAVLDDALRGPQR